MSPLLGPVLLPVVFQLQAPGLLPVQHRPGHSPDRPSWPCPGTPHDFTCLGGSEFHPAPRLCPPAKPLRASPAASEESRRPIVRPRAPPGRSPAANAGPPPGTVPPGPFPRQALPALSGAPHDFICLGGSESRPAPRLCPPAKPLHAPFRRVSPGGFGRVPAAYCPALRSSRSFSNCKRQASSRYSAARAIPQTGPAGPVRGPRMISPAWAEVNSARHQDFALRPNPCTRLPSAPRLGASEESRRPIARPRAPPGRSPAANAGPPPGTAPPGPLPPHPAD